jgi:excisionase family DNA binding protein
MHKVSELAKALGVTSQTVNRWISAGKVKALILPGGHKRIEDSEYKSVIADCKRENR